VVDPVNDEEEDGLEDIVEDDYEDVGDYVGNDVVGNQTSKSRLEVDIDLDGDEPIETESVPFGDLSEKGNLGNSLGVSIALGASAVSRGWTSPKVKSQADRATKSFRRIQTDNMRPATRSVAHPPHHHFSIVERPTDTETSYTSRLQYDPEYNPPSPSYVPKPPSTFTLLSNRALETYTARRQTLKRNFKRSNTTLTVEEINPVTPSEVVIEGTSPSGSGEGLMSGSGERSKDWLGTSTRERHDRSFLKERASGQRSESFFVGQQRGGNSGKEEDGGGEKGGGEKDGGEKDGGEKDGGEKDGGEKDGGEKETNSGTQ